MSPRAGDVRDSLPRVNEQDQRSSQRLFSSVPAVSPLRGSPFLGEADAEQPCDLIRRSRLMQLLNGYILYSQDARAARIGLYAQTVPCGSIFATVTSRRQPRAAAQGQGEDGPSRALRPIINQPVFVIIR